MELNSVTLLYFDIENLVCKCINVVSLGVVGGMVLHKGEIAEMRTGEGKTLVAILPAYLNALVGKGVHVVTVNDYLARRDCEWVGQVPRFLGMKVGLIQRMSHISFFPFPFLCLDSVSIYFQTYVHFVLLIWVLIVFNSSLLLLNKSQCTLDINFSEFLFCVFPFSCY